MSDASESDLVERLLARDEGAFDELITRLGPSMVRLATALVGSPAEAQDVVQETWLAVLDGLDRFERRSSLKTWVFRILTYRAKTWLSKRGRTKSVDFHDEASESNEPTVPADRFTRHGSWADPPRAFLDGDPEGLVMHMEARALLMKEVDELPEGQRVVVTLRDIEELESEEVCEVLGLTAANERVILHRARARLRLAMERHMSEAAR